MAIIKLSSDTGNEAYYLHEDHLGSTDVITNAAGTVVVRTSFDAWGQRRGGNWTGTPSTADKAAISASTHQGFTGHEQLDNLNLVHMNGRVYDPVIARFMSADPVIQDPYHSQSFNRYAYVWNNPLNATDPTGFCKVTGSHIEADVCVDWLTGSELDEHKGVSANGQRQGPTASQSVVEPLSHSAQVNLSGGDDWLQRWIDKHNSDPKSDKLSDDEQYKLVKERFLARTDAAGQRDRDR